MVDLKTDIESGVALSNDMMLGVDTEDKMRIVIEQFTIDSFFDGLIAIALISQKSFNNYLYFLQKLYKNEVAARYIFLTMASAIEGGNFKDMENVESYHNLSDFFYYILKEVVDMKVDRQPTQLILKHIRKACRKYKLFEVYVSKQVITRVSETPSKYLDNFVEILKHSLIIYLRWLTNDIIFNTNIKGGEKIDNFVRTIGNIHSFLNYRSDYEICDLSITDYLSSKKESYGKYISTGLRYFDCLYKDFPGYKRGTLNVVCGAYGMGKTKFMICLGANALKQGFNVVHITAENDKDEVMEDYISALRGREFIFDGEASITEFEETIQRVKGKIKIIKVRPLDFTVDNVKFLVENVANHFEPHLVVVDSLNLMTVPQHNSADRYGKGEKIMEGLFDLCKKYNIAIWTCAQLDRRGVSQSQTDSGDTARSENVTLSYAIPAFAHTYCTLNQSMEELTNGVMRVYVDKIRRGISKVTIPIYFDKGNMFLRDATEEEIMDYFNDTVNAQYDNIISKRLHDNVESKIYDIDKIISKYTATLQEVKHSSKQDSNIKENSKKIYMDDGSDENVVSINDDNELVDNNDIDNVKENDKHDNIDEDDTHMLIENEETSSDIEVEEVNEPTKIIDGDEITKEAADFIGSIGVVYDKEKDVLKFDRSGEVSRKEMYNHMRNIMLSNKHTDAGIKQVILMPKYNTNFVAYKVTDYTKTFVYEVGYLDGNDRYILFLLNGEKPMFSDYVNDIEAVRGDKYTDDMEKKLNEMVSGKVKNNQVNKKETAIIFACQHIDECGKSTICKQILEGKHDYVPSHNLFSRGGKLDEDVFDDLVDKMISAVDKYENIFLFVPGCVPEDERSKMIKLIQNNTKLNKYKDVINVIIGEEYIAGNDNNNDNDVTTNVLDEYLVDKHDSGSVESSNTTNNSEIDEFVNEIFDSDNNFSSKIEDNNKNSIEYQNGNDFTEKPAKDNEKSTANVKNNKKSKSSRNKLFTSQPARPKKKKGNVKKDSKFKYNLFEDLENIGMIGVIHHSYVKNNGDLAINFGVLKGLNKMSKGQIAAYFGKKLSEEEITTKMCKYRDIDIFLIPGQDQYITVDGEIEDYKGILTDFAYKKLVKERPKYIPSFYLKFNLLMLKTNLNLFAKAVSEYSGDKKIILVYDSTYRSTFTLEEFIAFLRKTNLKDYADRIYITNGDCYLLADLFEQYTKDFNEIDVDNVVSNTDDNNYSVNDLMDDIFGSEFDINKNLGYTSKEVSFEGSKTEDFFH